jgi:hypothetical protein
MTFVSRSTSLSGNDFNGRMYIVWCRYSEKGCCVGGEGGIGGCGVAAGGAMVFVRFSGIPSASDMHNFAGISAPRCPYSKRAKRPSTSALMSAAELSWSGREREKSPLLSAPVRMHGRIIYRKMHKQSGRVGWETMRSPWQINSVSGFVARLWAASKKFTFTENSSLIVQMVFVGTIHTVMSRYVFTINISLLVVCAIFFITKLQHLSCQPQCI